ncbi:molybdate ABC transporter substrate-binding protein [Halobacteriovorax marinus]|uniref:Molybdate ABC transporter substrate-binding protein n=1 Tax=Halobacteriovorax marinus TaxID=97084 RepID=A0A1Y5FAI1_9BACT|nr:molybdate ABC transporter substrate-binding protein [Halobacteriovorax marinus]
MKYILVLTFYLILVPTFSKTVKIAVASNFMSTMKFVSRNYEQETGNKVLISYGSTGKLYTQIKNGAPFDIFFSADELRADLLIREGLALRDSRFIYARGRIALYSLDLSIKKNAVTILKEGKFKFFAIANPKTAPYGSAAVSVLKSLKVYKSLESKLVFGENISQTFQFISTGNAALGIVSLSQLKDRQGSFFRKGEYYTLETSLHSPINQAAVILKRANKSVEVRFFLNYFKSEKVQRVLEKFGYLTQGKN